MSQSDVAASPTPRILKVGSCPSLSGLSTLSYELGCDQGSNLLVRLVGNSGSGYFNKDWFSFPLLDLQLLQATGMLTSHSFQACLKGKSVNTSGFLMAIFKDLGLIHPSEDNPRTYVRGDANAFLAKVNALIASSVDLSIDTAKKPRGRPKAIEPAESSLD